MKYSGTKRMFAFFSLILSVVFILPLVALATTTPVLPYNAAADDRGAPYTLLEPLPCLNTEQGCLNGVVSQVDLVLYLNIIFKLSIALAGVFAVLMLVIGGFQYLSTDAISGKEEGKERIWRALEGLIFVLASYFILYTINPRYVQLDPNVIPPLCDPKHPIQSVCKIIVPDTIDIVSERKAITSQALEEIATAQKEASRLRQLEQQAKDNGDFTLADQYEIQAMEQDKIASAARVQGIVAVASKNIISKIDDIENPDVQEEIDADRQKINDTYRKAIEEFSQEPTKVKELKEEQIVTTIGISQTIAVKKINDQLQSGASKINISDAREIKLQYLKETTNAYNELQKVNPDKAETLRLKSVEDLKQIDAAIAYREKCPRDTIYHPLAIAEGALFGPFGAGIAMYATSEKCN